MTPLPDQSERQPKVAFAWWQVECCKVGKVAWPDPCPWHSRDSATPDDKQRSA